MKPLTPRQEKFVEHFALCGNASEAARLAGYSAKTARVIANENLTKPAIQDAIAARKSEIRYELKLSREDLIAGIFSAIKMAREQHNPAVMINGCVQLAKLCGFYDLPVQHLELSDSAERLKTQISGMSDDQLAAILAPAHHQ